MAYTSKHTGKEIDEAVDIVLRGGGGGGSASDNNYTDEDKALVDTIPNKADKDGYYPKMSVGMADELVGRGDVQDAYINFRPSGGVNKNIKDGAARVKAIKGNSVVWNQLWQSSKGTWFPTRVEVVDEDKIVKITATTYDGGKYYNNLKFFPIGHKAAITLNAKVKGTVLVGLYGGVTADQAYMGALEGDGTSWQTYTIVQLTVNVPTFGVYISDNGDSIEIDKESIRIVDMTKMFNAGNEPKSYEEYLERKPMNIEDEYADNAGALVDMKVDSLISTSDNAYNPLTHKARVLGGKAYNITASTGAEFNVEFYNDETSSTTIYEVDGKYIFPANGYCQVISASEEDLGEICVCLNHSYDKPHPAFQQDVKDLSFIVDAFPEGMRSAGSVYDEIRFNPTKKVWEAVKRISEVDLGSFTWRIGATADTSKGVKRIDSEEHLLNMKTPTNTSIKANLLCKRYTAASANSVYLNVPMTVGVTNNGSIQIYDTEYNANDGSDLIAFKQAMQGIMLYYELAEPIVVELDYPTEETNMDYRVWDFGAEEAITSEPSAPFRAGIEYGFNATDDIRSLLERVAQLEARLTQLTNE